MSKSSEQSPRRAVALQYGPGQSAPVIVASGMGNMAEKIVLGREIPKELYEAIVEIYVYFLNFDPDDPEKFRRQRAQRLEQKKEEKSSDA